MTERQWVGHVFIGMSVDGMIAGSTTADADPVHGPPDDNP
jgi:hypothetical protein